MKTKFIFAFIILCIVNNTFAQSSINDYKYIIVPSKYDFLKETDQYQLNSLTKFLFNKYGFDAVLDNEDYPKDLANNKCLALRADLENIKSLFKTKLKVVLKNCMNDIIFVSKVGESREKEFKKTYNLTLRDAFKSFETLNFSYKPNKDGAFVVLGSNATTTSNQEVEKLKEEIKSLKNEQTSHVNSPINGEQKKHIERVVEVNEIVKQVEKDTKLTNVLYAQETNQGYQVVDSTPKVVMVFLSTPKQDTWIVKGRDAIVYKEDGFWYLSEYKGIKTTTIKLNIKF